MSALPDGLYEFAFHWREDFDSVGLSYTFTSTGRLVAPLWVWLVMCGGQSEEEWPEGWKRRMARVLPDAVFQTSLESTYRVAGWEAAVALLDGL